MTTKELQVEIRELLKERNAILLVHNYQRGEIQDIADMAGDSLGLSMQAARTSASVIVFCGVHFMAETASILCPDKTVLLPRMDAGCPMADMITAPALKARKKELRGVPVVTYVNSSAAVKARSATPIRAACRTCCPTWHRSSATPPGQWPWARTWPWSRPAPAALACRVAPRWACSRRAGCSRAWRASAGCQCRGRSCPQVRVRCLPCSLSCAALHRSAL